MKQSHLTESWKERLELYALGALKNDEQHEIEQHIETGCSTCSREVYEIQEALTLLPKTLPQQPLSSSAKDRILLRIHEATAEHFDARVARFEEIPWEETGLPGVSVHWLRQDKDSGTTVEMLRIKAGFSFTDHRHIGSEDCFVLQGGFQDDRGTYLQGQYIHYEAGSVQSSLRAIAGEDCILFLVNHGGIEYLP